jgi:hypothetical protein
MVSTFDRTSTRNTTIVLYGTPTTNLGAIVTGSWNSPERADILADGNAGTGELVRQ